jgi:peroxiredoxin
VLGACQLDLSKVGQLLFGKAIEESAAQLAYQQWKLQPAPEPLVQDTSGADSPEGTHSYLVGKPAPDFALDLLDGDRFRLADQRGKIIVLDFWATWCGPCLQTMPQLAQVAPAFADRNVRVVAINLQERAETITATLQRHKLQLPVALDRDGAVAARYGVSSIPQTLVIDREGNVFRHFIGGGPKLGDQLSESLRLLLPETPSQCE